VGGITEASVAELHAAYDGPFVRHQLTDDSVRGVWRLGGSMVVDQHRDRHGRHVEAPVLYCLGAAGELRPLLAAVGRRLSAAPARVTVEAHAEAALPAPWMTVTASRWDAMWTDAAPVWVPGEQRVERLRDDREINALLDVANPDSHGRPGDPGMRAWVGVREDADLVACGALSQVAVSEVAHLRGVSTLPRCRRRGSAPRSAHG
jgi:hypothetical protein